MRSKWELIRNRTSDSASQASTRPPSTSRIRLGVAQRRQLAPAAAQAGAAPARGADRSSPRRRRRSSGRRAPRTGRACGGAVARVLRGLVVVHPASRGRTAAPYICGMTTARAPVGAAGRLPDADRQPRGRHAAGARRAARRRRRRLRGHPPHADGCSTATAIRRARWSATTSTTSAPAPASWSRGSRAGRGRRARLRRGHAAGRPTPASCSCRPASRAGLAVEVLPGPSAALAALVASGLPAERWRFVGFLPRRRGELERLLVGTPETLVAFESPQRLAATLALLAAARPAARRRRLPRADQAARGGRARQRRRARRRAYGAERAARARSCSCAARRRRRAGRGAGARAGGAARAGRRRARGRARRRRRWPR